MILVYHQNKVIEKGFRGTKGWSAPEIDHNSEYFWAPADIFSMGVFLFNILTNSIPFDDSKPIDKSYRYIFNK